MAQHRESTLEILHDQSGSCMAPTIMKETCRLSSGSLFTRTIKPII